MAFKMRGREGRRSAGERLRSRKRRESVALDDAEVVHLGQGDHLEGLNGSKESLASVERLSSPCARTL